MRPTKPPGPAVALTPERAGRLYRLLTFLSTAPQTRPAVIRRLGLDTRGFYRDLEALRGLGITVTPAPDGRYALDGTLDDALARFPFPDPGLNVREALALAQGTTAAHLKLRKAVNDFLRGPRGGKPKKPR